MSKNIENLLYHLDHSHFKMLALHGNDEAKKQEIIRYLQAQGWNLINVNQEMLKLKQKIQEQKENDYTIMQKVKEWFLSLPDFLIFVNASILYEPDFQHVSPIEAFKYRTRNKSLVIFLEDEEILGNRICYGQPGDPAYYQNWVYDIHLEPISDIYIPEQEEDIQIEGKDPIKNYFDFNEIKDVIDIDTDLDQEDLQKELVKNFLVTKRIEEQILIFFDNLINPSHKAVRVIGHYGSGKSHLLAFLISLVTRPKLREQVTNQKLRDKLEELNREFYVVKFELQPGDTSIIDWVYGEIDRQLDKFYDIQIPKFDLKSEYNHKEYFQKIITKLKEQDQTKGLVLVMDEVSDFLQQKDSHYINRDIQFLRILAQLSQDKTLDFVLVTSMQEDVFSSPRFVEIAQSLGRVHERFQDIQIHRENIQEVISKRVIPKNEEQRSYIKVMLEEYTEYYEEIGNHLDEYVSFFPLHPNIFQFFSMLPYFEKRGIIRFVQNTVKRFMHKDFPFFITPKFIFEVITDDPQKRNLEEIYNVSEAVKYLLSKSESLEDRYKQDAQDMVKLLGLYNLSSREGGSATAYELALNMLFLPENKKFTPDKGTMLLIKKIFEAADAQYLKQRKTPEGTHHYYIDVAGGVDIEEKINKKIQSGITQSEQEDLLYKLIIDQLDLESLEGKYLMFSDQCRWKSTKSFRLGMVCFYHPDLDTEWIKEQDFAVLFLSPFHTGSIPELHPHQLSIQIRLNPESTLPKLQEAVALQKLIQEKFHVPQMQRRLSTLLEGTGENPGLKFGVFRQLIVRSEYFYQNQKIKPENKVSKQHAAFKDFFEEVKENIYDEHFNNLYQSHPQYQSQISPYNIQLTLNESCKDFFTGNYQKLSKQTLGFLKSLDMQDENGFPTFSESFIAQQIINTFDENKNTDIHKEIIPKFTRPPFGLETEMIYFVLALLTSMGKIKLLQKGGIQINAGNIKENITNLKQFENISYASLEKDLPLLFAEKLINTFGLQGSLIKLEKTRLKIFKEYKSKTQEVISRVEKLEEKLDSLSARPVVYLDRKGLSETVSLIKEINWHELDIPTYQDFSKISFMESKLSDIGHCLNMLEKVENALKDYDDLEPKLGYMKSSLQLLEDNPVLVSEQKVFKKLQTVNQECLDILSDFDRFLEKSERNPIKGKIRRFKQVYADLYYKQHEKYAGHNVDWQVLEDLQTWPVYKRIMLLKDIKFISFGKLAQKIDYWNSYREQKCLSLTKDQLENTHICPHCSFPLNFKPESWNINQALEEIEDTLNTYLQEFEKATVESVLEYQDNLEYTDIQQENKQIIQNIIKEKRLPSKLDKQLIQDINELFKEIEMVDFNIQEFADFLETEGKTLKVEQLEKLFYDYLERMKGIYNNEQLRIKVKKSDNLTQNKT